MFRFERVIPAAIILALGLSVAACSTSGHSFDPTDLLPNSWFGDDEKLPGERKPVFPDGVPGVSDGVPPELIKGNQQAAMETQPAPEAEPSAKPAPAVRPQSAKPKPQARTATAPQAQRAEAPAQPKPQSVQSAPPPQAAWPPPDATTFSR